MFSRILNRLEEIIIAGLMGAATVVIATACGVAVPMVLHALAARWSLVGPLGWGRG